LQFQFGAFSSCCAEFFSAKVEESDAGKKRYARQGESSFGLSVTAAGVKEFAFGVAALASPKDTMRC